MHPVCSSLAILPRVCAKKKSTDFITIILNQNMTILIEIEIQDVPIFFCNCCFGTFFDVSAVPCIYVAWK